MDYLQTNQEIVRTVEILHEKHPSLTKDQLYKIVRWAWDEVEESLFKGEHTSIYFPGLGTWVLNHRKLAIYTNSIYNKLIYNRDALKDKYYQLLYNSYKWHKRYLEIVDKKVENGYKVYNKK